MCHTPVYKSKVTPDPTTIYTVEIAVNECLSDTHGGATLKSTVRICGSKFY